MRINHFVQADIVLRNGSGRFWMDTCGGRDQVAMTILKRGWKAYEAPMPQIVTAWSEAFNPVFVDVGANTGFYSLLALVSGAAHAYAFEPVSEIADILLANVHVSEQLSSITLHRCAVGEKSGNETLYFPLDGHGMVETSASLREDFRSMHSAHKRVSVVTIDEVFKGFDFKASPVILKIDVESCEAAVLSGAESFVSEFRPAILAELLPGSDQAFLLRFFEKHKYNHYLLANNGPIESDKMVVSLEQRDHLFLPREMGRQWLDKLG